jgi:hypothetical protein
LSLCQRELERTKTRIHIGSECLLAGIGLEGKSDEGFPIGRSVSSLRICWLPHVFFVRFLPLFLSLSLSLSLFLSKINLSHSLSLSFYRACVQYSTFSCPIFVNNQLNACLICEKVFPKILCFGGFLLKHACLKHSLSKHRSVGPLRPPIHPEV